MEMRPIAAPPQPSTALPEREAVKSSPKPFAGAPATVAAAPAAGSGDDLAQALIDINKSLRGSDQGVEFSVDSDSERVIVKVIDRETREVLRQMPTEEALRIAKALDRSQGLLIQNKA